MNIGVDLVKVSRFSDYETLKDKILSNYELERYMVANDKQLFIASHFALKEAFLKSIKKGILEVDLKEIEVIKEESGAIHIFYNGKRYPCSLSHEDEYCIGVAMHD